MITKVEFMQAYNRIERIEEGFKTMLHSLEDTPAEIRQAFTDYHNEKHTLEHCIRWGLQAAKEIREDWHTVVLGLTCEDPEKGDGQT